MSRSVRMNRSMKTKDLLSIGIAGVFTIMLIPGNAAKNPVTEQPDLNANSIGIDAVDGGPTPTPSCPPAWSAGPAFPAAAVVRAVGNYFPANGRFYAMGGRSVDTAGGDFTHPAEFDPASNTWTTKAGTYPDNQVNNMACGVLTVGGTPQIYCVGGSAAAATTSTSRVFSYNPATDTVTTFAAADNWPGNTGGTILPGGFAVVANKLYIIGGFQISTNMVAAVWQFDPTAAEGSRWLQRLDYPVARGYVPAAAIGGFIYTAGGSTDRRYHSFRYERFV